MVKSIIEKSKNRFNISIAEVGDNDKWQRGLIGFATVSNDKKIVDETIERVIQFFNTYTEIEIMNIEKEIL